MKVKKNKVKEIKPAQRSVEDGNKNAVSKTKVGKENKRAFKQNLFNVNKVRSRLNQVYSEISNIFDILNLKGDSFAGGNIGNKNILTNGSIDDTVSTVVIHNRLVSTGKNDKPVKIKNMSASGNITKISWPKTLEGLVEARKLFKGKQLTYQERLLKRNLKNRLVKKRKRVEFQMKPEGKKSKKLGLIAEELCKNKKIKPVYNSEGKLIHSKYDFSEIGAKKDFSQKGTKNSDKISQGITVIEHETKNDKNIEADVESDTESFGKKSKKSEKQKQTRKKRKKNKLTENNNETESKQEPVKKKLKVIDEKVNNIYSDNESKNKTVFSLEGKPVFNKENKMLFSKIEFSDTNINKKLKKKEFKDPKKLLKKLEMKKAKIGELENSGDKEKAKELVEKEKWITALRKASGEKIKDDPQLLKKSIVREKSKKKRNQKKWEARLDAVKKKQQEKQKKRKENIMAKKKEKKKQKQKKAIKKGRYFPI